MSGPLSGLRVTELAGLGAAPFAGLLLADLGAEVVRVDRLVPGESAVPNEPRLDLLNRGRRSIAIDLKNPKGTELVLQLVRASDVLLEGFRPGVTERLGLGPDECMSANPRLVYGRVTGWGREGPYADRAGHDLNYIALAGTLEPIGTAGGPPVAPLNHLGDFAGGGMLLALGVLSAVYESSRSGFGQVVDAAMIDGAALLNTMLYGSLASGMWPGPRGTNIIDSGAHFMNVYECSDGTYMSVAAAEPRFYSILLERLGLVEAELPTRLDREQWPVMKEHFANIFRQRSRAEWCDIFEGLDACVAPVLSPGEAPEHPHNRARATFMQIDGVVQPSPAPRFARTPAEMPSRPPVPGEHTREVLVALGISEKTVDALEAEGVIATWAPAAGSSAGSAL